GLIGAAAAPLAYYVLRVYGTRRNAMVFAALTALTFNLPVAFPWFDHLAFLWALAALTCVAFVQAAPQPPLRRILLGAGASGLALTLAVMTKQNIGGAAAVLVGLLWLALPLQGWPFRAKVQAAVCCLGTALVSAVALAVYFESQGDFLRDVLGS